MDRLIKNLGELSRPQIEAIIKKAVVKGTGTCNPPPFNLAAIKARAENLDPHSQTKADMYMLILEVERLSSQ